MNCNLSPLQIKVKNSFLGIGDGYTNGTMVSVRSLMNQAFQFSVLLETGALYTGLPINALGEGSLSIKEAQAYDCIGSEIQVICFDLLRYMKCTVKTFDGAVYKGLYLFTIDFIDKNGLGRHPEQWKQFHVIDTEAGWMAYPQYRILFQDDALCPNRESTPKYSYNDKVWLSEQW